jgi:VWFA-related protein
VLVTVLDSDGMPIRDLKASDFLVREDNQSREVTGAEIATDPLFVVLLADTTKPPMGITYPTQDVRGSLSAFAKIVTTESPSAEIALVEYGGAAVMTTNFASPPGDLTKAIDRLVAGQRGGGVLLEALVEASKALAKRTSPRRVIVATNFGWKESSTLLPQVVADAVLKAGATVWTVAIQPPPDSSNFQLGESSTDTAIAANREIVMTNLPLMTGGLRLTGVTTTGLTSMMTKVANALTVQYVVTYAHPDGPPAKLVQATAKRGAKALTAPWVR